MISHGALKVLPLICLIQTGYSKIWTHEDGAPDPIFKSFSVISPVILHGRSKREIPSTRELDGHVPSITVGFQALGSNYLLDLELNRNVVSGGALLRYQRNGSMITDARTLNDDENCYYSGNVRHHENSSVAVSTCDGISGLVFDGHRTLFVSPDRSSGRHYLYREDDLTQNRTCGVPGPDEHLVSDGVERRGRVKRSPRIRGPYNSDRRSRYVELVLVVDNEVYKENGEDIKATIRRTKEIANIVNTLYTPLNIFVALVGVEVWTEFDEITLSENGDETLTSFLGYRREKLIRVIPNDNAQLLTGTTFQGGVVGKALKGPICTYEFSGGVNMDHSKQVSLVATTVAHEMGHNFGMEHDTKDCDCKDDRCIMSPSSSSISPNHWSKCSLNYLTQAFGHGMDYCLRNKPTSLYDSPVCGNGFVEPGEQCDCGAPGDCQNPCCDAPTCMLKGEAVCATGQCCDLTICRPKRAGIKCRDAEHECDLSEYCTGDSEYCPDDVHKRDGIPCQDGEAYCYDGVCRTRDKQCSILWGPSGKNSVDNCYYQNSKGNRLGNCGYNRLNQTYQRCSNQDVMCGMLHCAHINDQLEFGLESAAIISATFINLDGRELPCRTAVIDLGLRERDPGLVPNGAPCGHKKMCVQQKCVPVEEVSVGLCPDGCGGNGVCNSRGNCHCDPGWGPPQCLTPGDGGSVDSGPALDHSAAGTFVVILFVVFLGLVPAAAIIFCCIYLRRNNINLREVFKLPTAAAGGRCVKPPTVTMTTAASGSAERGSGTMQSGSGERDRRVWRKGQGDGGRDGVADGSGRGKVSRGGAKRGSVLRFLRSSGRKHGPRDALGEADGASQVELSGAASGSGAARPPPLPPPASLKASHGRHVGVPASGPGKDTTSVRPSGPPPPPPAASPLPVHARTTTGSVTGPAATTPARPAPGVPPAVPAAALKSRLGQSTDRGDPYNPLPVPAAPSPSGGRGDVCLFRPPVLRHRLGGTG